MLVDDEEAPFACIIDIICDKIKQQPLIFMVYRLLEWKMYYKYVNNIQREGPSVLDAINKISVLLLSMHCTHLFFGRRQRRNVCPYFWRSMQYNQITTVNSRGLSVVRMKMHCKYVNNIQLEGPAVQCRLIKIIAYMLLWK